MTDVQQPLEAKKGRMHKSRSGSRKRGSLFGALLGKKEEHDEKKLEKKEEEKASDAPVVSAVPDTVTKDETPVEQKTENPVPEGESTGLAADPVAIAARVMAQPVIPLEETQPAPVAKDEPVVAEPVTTTAEQSTPPAVSKDATKQNKRNSFFGTFFQRKDTASPVEEKKEKDALPPVPAKDKDAPSAAPALVSSAPASDAIAPVQPAEPTDVSTAPAPVSAPAEHAHGQTREKSGSLPKESFFGRFMKQEKTKHHEKDEKTEKTEVDKPVEGGDAAVSEPAPVLASPVEASPAAPASDLTNDKVEQPESATATPSTGHGTKDRRRTSFFSTLGTKKEKKAEVASDSEHGGASSSLPKLSGLFRKPSRAAKTHLESNKEPAPPMPEQTTTESTVAPVPETAPVIGEVAPAATGAPEAQHAPVVGGEGAPTITAVSEAQNAPAVNGAIGDTVPAAAPVSQSTVEHVPELRAAA